MAEFAYNNSVMVRNGMYLFSTNYGYHPMAMDPVST